MPLGTNHDSRADGRDPALDGLRGLAVLMVFVFHYGGGLRSGSLAVRVLGYLSQTGWTGVVLFFALSGFLITGILWDSLGARHQLRNFYARRALRILPLYYAALALCAVLSIAAGAQYNELSGLLYFIPFVQNLPYAVDRAFNGWYYLQVYHLWSLAVEEQFYLLWPALLLLARTRVRALRMSLWLFALCWLFRLTAWGPLYSEDLTRELHWSSPVHAGALLLGSALALALRDPDGLAWTTVQKYATPACFAGVATYLLTSLLCHSLFLSFRPQYWIGLTGVSIACAATIPMTLREGWLRKALSVVPLRWLGRISYGFYIFHVLLQPIFDALATHLTHAGTGATYQAIRFAVALPLSATVAWLSYRLFEQPILRLKRSFPMGV